MDRFKLPTNPSSDSKLPSASGDKPRWRRDFKGLDQVAGWVSKQDSDNSTHSSTNVRPISSLRDPSSFGPPPKRDPTTIIRPSKADLRPQVEGGVDKYEDRKTKPPLPPKPHPTAGASTQKPLLPPRRTNLPIIDASKKPPAIPPRLPSRRESTLPLPREVDDDTGGINMPAVERLGRAGISVPGFGISPQSPGTPPSQQLPPRKTTFAEKKAALTAAHSFYKSPTSVSISDAQAALETGRNFQKRHGDQAVSGLRKVEEMGIAERLQSHEGNNARDALNKFRAVNQSPLPLVLQGNEEKNSHQSPSYRDVAKKRPPPPPLPKRKNSPGMTAGPPPVPRHSRPYMDPNSPSLALVLPNNGIPAEVIPAVPPDLDLSLQTGWYAKSPLKPPEMIASQWWVSSSAWSRTPSGRIIFTLVTAVRYPLNLSTTKIKITWDQSAPIETAAAEQRHLPSPQSPPPTGPEWGDRIVAWAQAKLGQQVGNGYCYTLAYECFLALHGEDKSAGKAEKIMIPQGTSFGLCIFTHYVSYSTVPVSLPGTAVKPGDILQFWAARWIKTDSEGRVVYDKQAGAPEESDECHDHTAVVETVKAASGGAIIVGVLEANSGGNLCVTRGTYVLGKEEMDAGGVRVFRAVCDSWVPFTADW